MSGLSSHRSAQPSAIDAMDADSPTVRRIPSAASDQQDESTGVESAQTVIRKPPHDIPPPPSEQATPAEVAQVLVGAELGHFRLEGLIGGGGMGAVFRAADTRLNRTVAVKVIPRVGEDADLLRRFKNEAQSAAKLDHPNIARVYDVGQENGWHYIVFEYIDGVNLRDLVAREGVLSIDNAVYFTRQVAEALEHAHERGVVHRDVKPSNVLVTSTGGIKLVDMGLARSQQVELTEDMTASGVTLGTFDYISPEQARDPRAADVRSDLYSLGCTLYFVLVGRPPFPNGSIVQKLMNHGNTAPPNPQTFRPEIPPDLTAIIHKLLAKQPSDRYPRPIDLVGDLHHLAETHELTRTASMGAATNPILSTWPLVLQQHLPWIVAVSLLMISTIWVQMVSSDDDDVVIPQASDLMFPVSETPVLNPESDPAAVQTNIQPSSDPDLPEQSVAEVQLTTVTVDPSADNDDRLTVTSLSDALLLAGENTDIDTIEIRADQLVSGEIEIPRDGLTIQAADGFEGVLQFVTTDESSMEAPVMISSAGHPTTFSGLHLRWSVGMAREGGAMFGVSGALREKLDIRDCSITIENLSRRKNVYAFHVIQPSPDEDRPVSNVQAWFEWTNCVFRGQMTLIGMDAASRLDVQWTNGLLSVSERFLETGGAAQPPSAISLDELKIDLHSVTAMCEEGFAIVNLGPSGDHPIVVNRTSTNCVFATSPHSRQFEIRGIDDLQTVAPKCLLLKGQGNAYHLDEDRMGVIYRVSNMTGEFKEYSWNDLEDSDSWFAGFEEMRELKNKVFWREGVVPPDKSTHSQGPEDYLQDGVSPPGFNPNSIPKLPSELQSL